MRGGPSQLNLRLLMGALITARDAIDLTILVLRGHLDPGAQDDDEEEGHGDSRPSPPGPGQEKPPTFHSGGAKT